MPLEVLQVFEFPPVSVTAQPACQGSDSASTTQIDESRLIFQPKANRSKGNASIIPEAGPRFIPPEGVEIATRRCRQG